MATNNILHCFIGTKYYKIILIELHLLNGIDIKEKTPLCYITLHKRKSQFNIITNVKKVPIYSISRLKNKKKIYFMLIMNLINEKCQMLLSTTMVKYFPLQLSPL